MTQSEIADTLGIRREALARISRIRAVKSPTRLRQMMEILNCIEVVTGSLLAAYNWFRAEPPPGFGGAIPDPLLHEGRTEEVHSGLE